MQIFDKNGQPYEADLVPGEEYRARKAEATRLRTALLEYQACAASSPQMDGSVVPHGWNPMKLAKAFIEAHRVLSNVANEPRR